MLERNVLLIAFVATLSWAPSALATAPMRGYARFVKTKRVDPAAFRATSTRGLDAERRVIGRRLALATRGDGGAVGVELTNPSVTSVRTIYEVRSLAVPACAGGASATFTQRGRYFNSGAATPGDATGDVQGFVRVRQTAALEVLTVEGGIEQCVDATCSVRTGLGTPVVLGTVARDALSSVAFAWDAANDRFVFQLEWNPEVYVPYSVSDVHAAGRPTSEIEVETESACGDDDVRIDTRIRQVWVDASAL